MTQDARYDEEQATQRRARILGMNFVDTSQMPEKPLYKDILPLEEMQSLRIIPLQADEHNIAFGVTNTTSSQTFQRLRSQFLDQRVTFALISDTGFRDYMRLYNPPKQVVYEDITLKQEDNSSLI